jgi:hypothetical protein
VVVARDTTTLFAALGVLTGVVIGRFPAQTRELADESLICPLGASSLSQASKGSIPVSRTSVLQVTGDF